MIINLPKIDQIFFLNVNEMEGRNDENEGLNKKVKLIEF